ncbi:MAG: murein biosynthesis integral membrane protein MurJ [Rhodobiaceae bacterium]|nr:murein biosynthesis integral membrane protein MurJ [Rhodobiaceae bacterium]
MNLVRSAMTVGGMTLISRFLGFARDILIAGTLGTGPIADAFFVAFKFPNLFRRLFAEGAFNSAFVPLFAKRLEGEGEASAKRFAEEALSVLLFTLIVLTIVAELTMPWLMYVIAPGFADTPDKFELGILLTRIAFPYLLFMSLVALLSAVLNSVGRFTAAAAPIALNIVLIAALVVVVPHFDSPGVVLAWGVVVAGILQFIMLLIAVKRAGFAFHLRAPRLTPGVRRLVTLGIPGFIAGGATQFNLLAGSIIASLQDGAVSLLYYADRIYQLPLGVVGIAIGIVLLPDLSRRLRGDDMAGASNAQNRAFEFAMLLTLPAAVALAVIPGPIIQVLFERGAFTAADTHGAGLALAGFAIGLPAFVLIKVLSPGFFAREDTKTPMRFAAIGIAVNIVGSLALFFWIGHVGIALATSAAAWINAILLGVRLVRLGHFEFDARLKSRLPRLGLSAAIMGAGLWGGTVLAAPLLAGSFVEGIVALALLIGGGGLLFGIAILVTGAAKVSDLKNAFRRA